MNSINATTVKVITGCVMAVVLTIFYAVSSYAGHPVDAVAFGEMCVFAAAFSGIAYASQKMQRTTDYNYVAAQTAAQQAAQVATSAETPAPAAGNDDGAPIVAQTTIRRAPRGRSR